MKWLSVETALRMETVKFSIEMSVDFVLAQELTHILNFPCHFVSQHNIMKVRLASHPVNVNLNRNLTNLMDPRK